MKKSILFLVAFIALFSSCKKEQTTFSGVTYRDENGNQIGGTPDSEDWHLNDNWNSQEQSLFSGSSNSLCSSSSSIQVMAYPNPNNGIFSVNANIDSTQTISFRIVNQNYEILNSRNVSSSNVMFNVNASNQIVRVYYKIIGNGCEYRGHGEVQIN